ncbi:MAG: hypothetical protein ACPL06_01170 [Candidatus Anstonellales archaeon]
MRFWALLIFLMFFIGCVSDSRENNGNKVVKIIEEKVYSASEGMNNVSEREGGISTSENISESMNQTENNTANLNTTNQSFEEQNHAEGGGQKIDGTYFGNNKYVLVLKDISMQRNENGYCGLFEIVLVENSTTLQKLQICPGEDATWVSPEGKQYRIKVIDTAAGYTGAARWAKVIIYS